MRITIEDPSITLREVPALRDLLTTHFQTQLYVYFSKGNLVFEDEDARER